MFLISPEDLIDKQSKYNEDYCCTIDKVEILRGVIRIFIDEKGNNSLGELQDPMLSRLVVVKNGELVEWIAPFASKFSIKDRNYRYLGYLDFTIDLRVSPGSQIGFRFGESGYSLAKLFRLDQSLIDEIRLRTN